MTLSANLERVTRALDAATELDAQTLANALQGPLSIDDIAPYIRFDAHNYLRNLVTRSPKWELRLLCWRPGQSSSVHGHHGSACAFRILRGSATEFVLGERDRVWAPGDIVQESSAGLIHQVGNTAGDPLLTLHAYSPALPVDAPSPREGREIVIIGGGFSGVAMAYHLLKRGGADLRITLVERGPWLGRGVAYGVDSNVFRLNVPAANMSIDPEDPGDFVRWAGVEDAPTSFLERARYGAYVVQRLGELVRSSRGKLRLLRGEAVAIEADHAVRLADHTLLPRAEAIVLATGISPRMAPSELPNDARILDAWDECALATLPPAGDVLIIGSGLSAIDVTALLSARKFQGKITILSRHGLLPRPHLSPLSRATPLARELADDAPRNLRGLLRWGRALARETVRRGEPWQHAIDALRPHVGDLWRNLPPSDRARFARSVRPYWNVLRHRAPATALAIVDRWREEGRLDVLAGTVANSTAKSGNIEVTMRLDGGAKLTRTYDAVVRCIGPTLERSETDTPLVQCLLADGRAALDQARLGILTDGVGRVIDESGKPSDALFALGALRRASSWETTAVPDISVHALDLARRILA